jgi:hypothetical protein
MPDAVTVVGVSREVLGLRPLSPVVRSPGVLLWLDGPLRTLLTAYFRHARVRRLLDGIGVTAKILESGHFDLPPQSAGLPERLGRLRPPSFEAQTAVLVERRRTRDGHLVVHLVNYSDSPCVVRIRDGGLGLPDLLSPDPGSRLVPVGDGCVPEIVLERYAVLRWVFR